MWTDETWLASLMMTETSRQETPGGTSPAHRARDRGPVPALVHALEPGVDLFVGFVLGKAVALLQPAGQLRPLALDHVEIVVGELAPLLLNLALELFPIAFDTVPIHLHPPVIGIVRDSERTRGEDKSSVKQKFLPTPRHRTRAVDCSRRLSAIFGC